jgi:hypothetical protein
LAIKRHLEINQRIGDTVWGERSFFFFEIYTLSTILRRQPAKCCKTRDPNSHKKRSFLVAARAVTEAALATLGGLSLRDGDDVDGDGVEL